VGGSDGKGGKLGKGGKRGNPGKDKGDVLGPNPPEPGQAV
jgi:hypothetical protein